MYTWTLTFLIWYFKSGGVTLVISLSIHTDLLSHLGTGITIKCGDVNLVLCVVNLITLYLYVNVNIKN